MVYADSQQNEAISVPKPENLGTLADSVEGKATDISRMVSIIISRLFTGTEQTTEGSPVLLNGTCITGSIAETDKILSEVQERLIDILDRL
jgi:hypothetical protein